MYYKITPEKFVAIWQSSKTIDEAAKRLKMPKAIACSRASYYRKMGIKLKTGFDCRRRLDKDKLNKIIDDLAEASRPDEGGE